MRANEGVYDARSWRGQRLANAGFAFLALLVVVRHLWVGNGQVDAMVAELAKSERVITIGRGDVSLRDAPKAQEILRGHLFTDAHYAGEANWYPFFTPLVVATYARATHTAVPQSYFRVEVGFTALFLIGALSIAFALARWAGLVIGFAVMAIGWWTAGSGMYPADSARGALFLVVLFISRARLRVPSCQRRLYVAAGAVVGMIGLWHAASFVISGELVLLFVLLPTVRLATRRMISVRALLERLLLFALALVIPMALIFVPQLLRYGTIRSPRAASHWLDPTTFTPANFQSVLHYIVGPSPWLVAPMILFAIRNGMARRFGLERVPMLAPLAAAYLTCVFLGSMGFAMANAASVPALAQIATLLTPVPPHTFYLVAQTCVVPIQIAGSWAAVELLLVAIARWRRVPWQTIDTGVQLAAIFALAWLAFSYQPAIERFANADARGFAQFVERTGAVLDGAPLFLRHHGRFVQHAPLKILAFSVLEHSNPYVHEQRSLSSKLVDQAVLAGAYATATAVLVRYQIGYLMEEPGDPDAVVQHCAGESILTFEKYAVRRFVPCHP